MPGRPAARLRAGLVWLTATAAAAAGARLLLLDLHRPMGTVEDALTALCEVALLGCLVWAWAATTAVVGEVLLRRAAIATVRDLPGVPRVWRRWVLLACGAALTVGVALPAGATPGSVHLDPGGRGASSALDGLPMPERAVDLSAVRASAPANPQASAPLSPPRADAAEQVVVRSGDSLWSIAGSALGAPERWREIYDLNRAAIGADPDLVLPGQHLTLPPT